MCKKPKKSDCTANQGGGAAQRPIASFVKKPAARPKVAEHGSKLKPPAVQPPCRIGSKVTCPGTGAICTGNQCCPDHSTCPSAAPDFDGCAHAKTAACTLPASSAKQSKQYCKLGQEVQCPGAPGTCNGNQCCADGSTCPSAGNDFVKVCKFGKKLDCLEPGGVVGLVRRFGMGDEVSAVDDHDYRNGFFFPTGTLLLMAIGAIGAAAVVASARLRQYQLLPVEVLSTAPILPSDS